MLDPDGEPIAAIEYQYKGRKHGWKPHSVFSDGGCYDFDFLPKHGLCYHMSGNSNPYFSAYSGAPKECARVWLRPGVVGRSADGKSKALTPEDFKAMGIRLIKSPIDGNPFKDDDARETDTDYCDVCEERMPSDEPCQHIAAYTCDGVCWCCGSAEVEPKRIEKSFHTLWDSISDEDRKTIAAEFRAPEPDFSRRQISWPEDEHNAEKRFEPALYWMESIDHRAKAAIEITRGWIALRENSAWRQQCVLPTSNFVYAAPKDVLAQFAGLEVGTVLGPKFAVTIRHPLRKVKNAHDHVFNTNPGEITHLTLGKRRGKLGMDFLHKMTVAEVRMNRGQVQFIPGSIVKK